MKRNPKIKSEFVLFHKGHQMNFPSEQSMRHYVDDFVAHFPDVETSDLQMYRADIYQLETNKKGVDK